MGKSLGARFYGPLCEITVRNYVRSAVWRRTTPLGALYPTRLKAFTRARYSVLKCSPSTEQAVRLPR